MSNKLGEAKWMKDQQTQYNTMQNILNSFINFKIVFSCHHIQTGQFYFLKYRILFKDMEIIVSSPAASKEVEKEAESEQKSSGEDVEIKTFEMKRELGFTSSIAIIIGTIVGT